MEPFIQYFNRYPNFDDVKRMVTSDPLNFTWTSKLSGGFHYRTISRMPQMSLASRNIIPHTICSLSPENDWEPKQCFTKLYVLFKQSEDAALDIQASIIIPHLRFRVLDDFFALRQHGKYDSDIARNFEHGAVFEKINSSVVKTKIDPQGIRSFSFFDMHENEQRWLFKGWRYYNEYEKVTGKSQTERVLKTLVKTGHIEPDDFLEHCRILKVKLDPGDVSDEMMIGAL